MSARYFETLRMVEDIAITLGNQNQLTHKGPVYHVKVDPDQDAWQVTCLGAECVDSPYKARYFGVETLPADLRKKLVVLNMLEPQQSEVEGIGLRTGQDSYWVYG